MPVRWEDWPLLGCKWKNQYFVDKCLPFGLRSAPAHFNCLADDLDLIIHYNYGVEDLRHHLSDFFPVGSASLHSDQSTAAIQMRTTLAVLDMLNVLVAEGEDKVAGAATSLKLLGILFHSNQLIMCSPNDKMQDLTSYLAV